MIRRQFFVRVFRTSVVFSAAAALFLLPAVPAVLAQQEAPDAPVAQVERLHDALIHNMIEADELGYEGRESALEPIVAESFDAEYMMRVATGRFWQDFSPEQKALLSETFVKLTIATYASRFDEFSGQSFETLGAQEGRPGLVLVKTQLNKADGDAIAFNYMLRGQDGGGWKIQDIFLRGTASQLAVYRSEYTSVLENKSFDGLIDTMRSNIRKLSGQ